MIYLVLQRAKTLGRYRLSFPFFPKPFIFYRPLDIAANPGNAQTPSVPNSFPARVTLGLINLPNLAASPQ